MKTDTPFCDRVASVLALGPGEVFQDREAWERTARAMERERNVMLSALRRIASNDGRGSVHPSECDGIPGECYRMEAMVRRAIEQAESRHAQCGDGK